MVALTSGLALASVARFICFYAARYLPLRSGTQFKLQFVFIDSRSILIHVYKPVFRRFYPMTVSFPSRNKYVVPLQYMYNYDVLNQIEVMYYILHIIVKRGIKYDGV